MQKAIQYKDVNLSYQVFGNGNPVVLIHGVAEDGNVWQEQVAALQKTFKLVVIDLPGSGRSAANGHFAMEDLADAVHAVLAAEVIAQAVLIGHSMGGYVLLAFAEKYPAQVNAFGLFHSSAFADDGEKMKTREKNVQFILKNGTEAFLQQSTPTLFSEWSKKNDPSIAVELIERYKNFSPDSLAAYQQAMKVRPDRTALFKRFVKPVLFIIGRYDNAIPFADSLKQCHLPVFSYIHILEDSGHMGLLEETEKSNAILQNFLHDVYLENK